MRHHEKYLLLFVLHQGSLNFIRTLFYLSDAMVEIIFRFGTNSTRSSLDNLHIMSGVHHKELTFTSWGGI